VLSPDSNQLIRKGLDADTEAPRPRLDQNVNPKQSEAIACNAPQADADLTRLVSAWSTLPKHIKAAVMALVATVQPAKEERPGQSAEPIGGEPRPGSLSEMMREFREDATVGG
jgi:hypothetical protein